MTGDELIQILGGYPQKVVDATGKEHYQYSAEIKDLIESQIKECKVLARCNPDQKQAFIAALRTRGDEVAVTGKSITDTKALKMANVSFCMGTGTDIAKDASQIIFLDDNINSVYKATLWGRNILDNIRKFLQF